MQTGNCANAFVFQWLQEEIEPKYGSKGEVLLRLTCPSQACSIQIENSFKYFHSNEILDGLQSIKNWVHISDRKVSNLFSCSNNDVLIYRCSQAGGAPDGSHLGELSLRKFRVADYQPATVSSEEDTVEQLNCLFRYFRLAEVKKRSLETEENNDSRPVKKVKP